MIPTAGAAHANVAALDQLEDIDFCEDCEDVVSDFFCNVCQCSLCSDCWDRQPAHRRKRLAPGQIPHEKTELLLANRVHTVFSCSNDQRVLAQLHKDDEATAWFGLERELQDERPFLFRDHGRFAELATLNQRNLFGHQITTSSAASHATKCVPSLVSFVGQTGAGKSTLIKLLVQFNQWSKQNPGFPSPVPGSTGRDLPTSEDVHLYADPLTAGTEFPILFADSEGLDGGEREPLAAALRKQRVSASISSGSDYAQPHCVEREVLWMDSKRKRTRQFAAGQLYPRVLFAFSDVVVFVHRNPRAVEGVLERLLEWGNVAIETTYNQPILPFAILALNATENDADSELWDVQIATETLLDSLADTVDKNVEFSKHAELWRKRGKTIVAMIDLMLCYYSALRIIRLPTNGRPKLVQDQAQKLYLEIDRGCRLARASKAQSRMQLNAFEFQAYLNHAFDHFCSTIDAPFDFVKCSYLTTRLPTTFSESILILADTLARRKPRPKASTVFEKLGRMIASCIMLDSVRSNLKGDSERVFAQYVAEIDTALKEFMDRHWPCEFFLRGAVPPHLEAHLSNLAFQQSMREVEIIMRCANVRNSHAAKGHQLTDGRVFARGAYQSSFSYSRDRGEILNQIYVELHHLMEGLTELSRENINANDVASLIHLENALPTFFSQLEDDQQTTLRHTLFCVCCMLGKADTPLPCGHVLCRACLQIHGKDINRASVKILRCPFPQCRTGNEAYMVQFRSASAGVRVLALSNGGVRSVIQFEILKLILQELGGKISVQSLFDLIIGEGTGGIIALGLVNQGWLLHDCERNILDLFGKIFDVTNQHKLSVLQSKSRYTKHRVKALEEGLGILFDANQRILDLAAPKDDIHHIGRAAVLVSSATGEKILCSNYRVKSLSKAPFSHYPITDQASIPRTLDIARASMALPRLFRPYTDPRLGDLLFRKDTSENFLIEVAQTECKALYPGSDSGFPDVMLHLGCGQSPQPPTASIASNDTKKSRSSWWTRTGSDEILSLYSGEDPENYAHHPRTNFISLDPLLEDLPEMDDVTSIASLQLLIRDATDPEVIRKTASQLFATLFYAEIDKPVEETAGGETLLLVHIYCRLLDFSDEVAEAGRLLKHGPFRKSEFVFWENDYGPQQFPITSAIIDTMTCESHFPALNILLPIWQTDSTLHGVLRLENGDKYCLSGFPRRAIPSNVFIPLPKSGPSAEPAPKTMWRAPSLSSMIAGPSSFPIRGATSQGGMYRGSPSIRTSEEAPAYDSESDRCSQIMALPLYSQ